MRTMLGSKGRKGLMKYLFVYGMLAFSIVYGVMFIVYPNISTLFLAFQDPIDQSWTFENFSRLWFELNNLDSWKYALKNSFLYFPVNAFVGLPLSVLVAFFLYKKVWGSKAFKAIYFLPNVLSVVVLAFAFKTLFNDKYGPINDLLVKCGLPEEKLPAWFADPKYAMNLVYVFSVWLGIGYNVVVISGAMSRLPQEVMEASQMDGAGLWRELFFIIIPLVWDTISMFLITSAITVFTMYLHPMMLTFNIFGGTYTLAWNMVEQLTSTSSNVYFASAIGIVLAVLGMILVKLVRVLTDRVFQNVEF